MRVTSVQATFFIGVAALILAVAANGQLTWYVDDDAPGDPGPGDPTVSDPLEDGSPEHPFDAIQEGILAAWHGDTVLVLDGTYTGDGNRDIDFSHRRITVRSDNGPEACIIDCEQAGRGFYVWETAPAVVDGFTITKGCATGAGGAICCSWSRATIANCIILDNAANSGGGIYLGDNGTIADCLITGNTAEGFGGGIRCGGGDVVIAGCTVVNNLSGGGGGIYDSSGNLVIANCLISGNFATSIPSGCGGGLWLSLYGTSYIINCVIAENLAVNDGGGMYLEGGDYYLANCTIAGNVAVFYGGGLATSTSRYLDVRNCIFWEDAAGIGPEIAVLAGGLTLGHNDVCGGEIAVYCGEGGMVAWGLGNIDADPLFADQNSSDYHISIGSPCIDAGNNFAIEEEEDLDGNPRFVDDPGTADTGIGTPPIVDMGAYEFQGQTCFGDLDGDNDVDLSDLAILLSNYGSTGTVYTDGDLDRDEDVDLTDLAMLLSNYGTTCE